MWEVIREGKNGKAWKRKGERCMRVKGKIDVEGGNEGVQKKDRKRDV